MHRIQRLAVVDQLHRHVLPPEVADQFPQLDRGYRRAFAAAGQHQHVPAQLLHHLLNVVNRAALLPTGQLRVRDHLAQPLVAGAAAGQSKQVRADRIRRAALRLGQAEGELGAVPGADAEVPSGLGETDRAGHAVVVGQHDGVQVQPHRLLHQRLRGGDPVEEGAVRVRVQLGVRDASGINFPAGRRSRPDGGR